MKLDKKIKQKWLKALRSGSYEQGTGCLRGIRFDKLETYCCLGVLCDVVAPNNWIGSDNQDHGYDGELSPIFLQKIGMTDNVMRKLIAMNDGDECGFEKGANFKEIASYISRNL